jgi:hypothetical protein
VCEKTCAPSQETNACYKCEDEHCCEAYASCKANAECTALLKCVQSCPDGTCWAQCYQDHANGVKDYAPRLTCLEVWCFGTDACSNAPPAPCFSCFTTKCQAEFVACNKDPECFLLSECYTPCGTDAACIMACDRKFPQSAHDLLQPWLECTKKNCGPECG